MKATKWTIVKFVALFLLAAIIAFPVWVWGLIFKKKNNDYLPL